jgi:hypothetical protein
MNQAPDKAVIAVSGIGCLALSAFIGIAAAIPIGIVFFVAKWAVS